MRISDWSSDVCLPIFFEFDNFTEGSRQVAEAIVEATRNGAFSLIGGGDSAACIAKFGMDDDVSYVSTGGGALLEYMEGKELPGDRKSGVSGKSVSVIVDSGGSRFIKKKTK